MKKRSPYPLYLSIQGSYWFFFSLMATISSIYRLQSAGLNPLQLVLVGTVLEATVFLFEIPTGIVADLYSRRLSVIIGYALIGLGFMFEGAFPVFWAILLAQVTWGLGATFTSGAQEAWLADEMGEEGLTHTYLRGAQVGQIGIMAGIIVSVGLATIALNLPLLVGGAGVLILALYLAIFMPEEGFRPTPSAERSSWRKMQATFRTGLDLVRGQTVLVLMMVVAVVYGLYSEGLDRLWEAHFLTNFTFPQLAALEPVIWFGLIRLGRLALTAVATEIIRRRLADDDRAGALKVLIWLSVLMTASLGLFALAGQFGLAVAAVWGVFAFRGASAPLYAAWLNRELESATRATVLSMRGQLDAIGQFIGGPIIGAVATWFSLRWAMVGVGLFLAPVIFLYAAARRLLMARPFQEISDYVRTEEDLR